MKEPHLYIVGIGGVGTVWIADWALANGWRVSGSDIVESDRTRLLAEAGADIHYGTNPELIPADITEAVINSAITPVSPSFPEYQELLRRRIPVRKRAFWIGRLTKQSYTIAVAGTHGKTTTTAMIGWILDKAGLDPTVLVGGSLAAWGGKTKIGKSPFLVIEADEFDRSFHQFYPQIAVLLNLELDHADYYKNGLPEIEQAFRRFLRNLPYKQPKRTVSWSTESGEEKRKLPQGLLISANLPRLRKVSKGFPYNSQFLDLEKPWPGMKLKLPGKHNMGNAYLAAKAAHALGIPSKIILQALAEFPGVGRRFEYLGKKEQAEVYDDYAHHPDEVKATLQALSEFKGKSTCFIFQPHQKARTVTLLKEFGRAFDQNPPTELILAPIYQVAGRESDIEVSSQDIADQIRQTPPQNIKLSVPKDNQELEEQFYLAVKEYDLVMVVGAGDIRVMADRWMR